MSRDGGRGMFSDNPGVGLIPTGADWIDSLNNTLQFPFGIPIYRPNCLGVLRLQIGQGCTQFTAMVPDDIFGASTADDSVSIYLDGAFYRALSPVLSGNGLNAYTFLLDGAPHILELYAPYQEYNPLIVGDILGAFLWRLQCSGGSVTILPSPVVAKRLVVYGDSIACGALASPSGQLGWLPLLRQSYTGRISLEAWGGRALWDDSGAPGGYGFPSLAQLASRLVNLGFSRPTIAIWDAIGINDWSPGFNHWSAASFGAACGTLYDAIHALNPAIHIYAQTPLITTHEALANGFGNIPADYRAAKAAAAAARPTFVTTVSGPGLMGAGQLAPDGIHPTTAGHATLAASIGGVVP